MTPSPRSSLACLLIATSFAVAQEPVDSTDALPAAEPPRQETRSNSPTTKIPPSDTALFDLGSVEVVGRRDRGYKSRYSYGATKVGMETRDIPQSLTTVTKELIQDQGARRLADVVNNVAGVNVFSTYDDIVLRGFRSWGGALVNGHKAPSGWYSPTLFNVERLEVVKGPASALFSNVVPGGTVNYVTRKPLETSRKEVTLSTGSFDDYAASIDLTGPVDSEKRTLYRAILGYENSGSFRDNLQNRTLFAAPSLTFRPDASTNLHAELVVSRNTTGLDRGMPSTRDAKSPDLPISTNLMQPGDFLQTDQIGRASCRETV